MSTSTYLNYEEFEKVYNRKNGSPLQEFKNAIMRSINYESLGELAAKMIRQHHTPHAKSSTEPNPQNAAQKVAEQKGSAFSQSTHPLLKDYSSSAVTEVIRENRQEHARI